MERLIDADVLKEWIENWFVMNAYYHPYSKSNNIPIPELHDILERMPTVDAVEVVRCKDCIHYWKNSPSDGVPVCLASPKDNAFCSEGERREDA